MEAIKNIFRPILKLFGYYTIKSKWRWHQYITRLQKEDKKRNAEIYQRICAINGRILPPIKDDGNITVSLTSYNTRVERFAPYAIYSILQQTVLPNRIVLNIDQEKWNQENLPYLIKQLQIAGLEVNFCEDKGPHTKLLPTLKKYPNDIIITMDDDVCYVPTVLEELLNEYKISPSNTIVCRNGCHIAMKDGHIQPYSQWKDAKSNDVDKRISPFGVNGVLYPPHIFSEEIHNSTVFREHCKCADDIWFTIIELLENIPVRIVSKPTCFQDSSVDHYNEYVAQNSDALHFQNAENGMNDVQLKNLLKYYNLI